MGSKNIIHKKIKEILRLTAAVGLPVASFSLSGCSAHDEPDMPESPTPQIVVLFSPGGLGDMSYNDCILSGVQQFKKNNPAVDVFMASPTRIDEAERIFTDWLKRPGSDIPVLFVLASSDYETLVDRYLPQYPLAANKSLLLFETLRHYEEIAPRTYTFQISMHGASYLAGVSAKTLTGEAPPLVIMGSSTDVPTFSARDGFMSGFGADCNVEYLADDWTGYVMPAYTYRSMSGWAQEYGFIFPVAGGSNAGIYRYSREYDASPYLAGMDIDQSGFSNKITGSVVKRFDRLVEEYFSQWLADGTMPTSQIYGLGSGYVDWEISPRYETLLRETVESNRERAIISETKYYE